jgi:hypothetical protein
MNRRNSGKPLLWLLALTVWFLAGQAHANDLPSLSPRIAGLERARLLSGEEAVCAINRSHGIPIDMKRGFVAFYEAPGEKATIWVSEALAEELGVKQIDIMIAKMKGNHRSPFSRYRTVVARNTEVIGFDGLGQVHYVFRIGKWVYWISADEKRIDELLDHVIKAP